VSLIGEVFVAVGGLVIVASSYGFGYCRGWVAHSDWYRDEREKIDAAHLAAGTDERTCRELVH